MISLFRPRVFLGFLFVGIALVLTLSVQGQPGAVTPRPGVPVKKGKDGKDKADRDAEKAKRDAERARKEAEQHIIDIQTNAELIKIEMNFLPDVYVECEECKGTRYNKETLDVKYKEKSVADVLAMTVEEALLLFQNIPSIRQKLETLSRVGLEYIKLGQSSTTLSGGEAQRIKLTLELAKRGTGKTMYLLDEPTTGLHFHDVKKLIKVLQDLVDMGNSIIVIEHNLDVIKSADWIIDLGPEGGDAGGEIIAEGTPETVSKNAKSYTGQFLKKML
jgi:excinuclease ABC subunit A